MGKAIKIRNRDKVIHRLKLMLKLLKSCPKDATFEVTYEIIQIDKDFMKRAEKFNQEYRAYEDKETQKEMDKQTSILRTEAEKKDNI